jgi:FMN reductase
LKPVLVELGATCPTASLYLIDKTFESDQVIDHWVERWGPVVDRNVSSARTGAP